MRIAQVAPLYESVPPKFYGGTERIVYYLTEALVRAGHEVTLFATADSQVSHRVRLISTAAEGLRFAGTREALAPHILMFEKVRAMQDEFDIIHFHNEYAHFPIARHLRVPCVSTQHGRLDLPEYKDLFYEFRDLPLVSISDNQRIPLPSQNWVRTIHHGIEYDHLTPTFKPKGEYLAFLGRICADKGFLEAVEMAKRTGNKLKIAAKIDAAETTYFEKVSHLFDDPQIEFIGEVNDSQKAEFLGNAKAMLFPIRWPEPFGLVMIEALACGTPVIAFKNGSVPEVLAHGKTAYIVEDVEEGVRAIEEIDQLSREECRLEFESRFTADRMAQDYLLAYRAVINAHRELESSSEVIPLRPPLKVDFVESEVL